MLATALARFHLRLRWWCTNSRNTTSYCTIILFRVVGHQFGCAHGRCHVCTHTSSEHSTCAHVGSSGGGIIIIRHKLLLGSNGCGDNLGGKNIFNVILCYISAIILV
jgi:hypothetical protein